MRQLVLAILVMVCACDELDKPSPKKLHMQEHVLDNGVRCLIFDTGGTGLGVSCDFSGFVPKEKEDIDYARKYWDLARCPMFNHFERDCLAWETNVELLCEPGPNLELCTGQTKLYYERMKKAAKRRKR